MARKSGIELRRTDRMRFNRKMKKLQKFVRPSQGFDMELKKYVSRIAEISTDFVPVITGKLRQSLFLESKAFNYVVGYKINYAVFVEFGKVGRGSLQGRKPFFRPAIKMATFEFIKNLRKNLKQQTR
jgi:phage gpG-like protein|tara:strand:- start:547 stop:927 length:381 start_codon:yes stop_codon:yes gene_type:complete